MVFLRIRSKKSKKGPDSPALQLHFPNAVSHGHPNSDDSGVPNSPIADSFMIQEQHTPSTTMEGCTSSLLDDIVKDMNAVEIRDPDINSGQTDSSLAGTAILLPSICEASRDPSRTSGVKIKNRPSSLPPPGLSSGQITVVSSSAFKGRCIVPDSDASDSDESSSIIVPITHSEKPLEKKPIATTKVLMSRMKERHRKECRKSWNAFDKSFYNASSSSFPLMYSMSSTAVGRSDDSLAIPLKRSVSALAGLYENPPAPGSPSLPRMSLPPHSNNRARAMQGPALAITHKATAPCSPYPFLNTSKPEHPSVSLDPGLLCESRNAPRQLHRSLSDLAILGGELPNKESLLQHTMSSQPEKSVQPETRGPMEAQACSQIQEQCTTQKQCELMKGPGVHQQTQQPNPKVLLEMPLSNTALDHSKEDKEEEESPPFAARQVVPLGDTPPVVLVSQSETGRKHYYLLLPQQYGEATLHRPHKECLHGSCHQPGCRPLVQVHCCHHSSQKHHCQGSSSKGCTHSPSTHNSHSHHSTHKCSRTRSNTNVPLTASSF